MSEHIAHLVSDSDIDLAYSSDHSAISLSICFHNEKRGKGYWKLNSQLLKSQSYVEMVKTVISETVKECSTTGGDTDCESVQLNIDDQTFFEIINCKIRSASIQLSVNQCKEKNKEENTLKLELRRLEKVFDINPTTNISIELEPKRQLLQKLRENRVVGAIIRSRAG